LVAAVGTLFILAAATAIVGFVLYGLILNDPDHVLRRPGGREPAP
jgi:hypothetical protein